MERLTNP